MLDRPVSATGLFLCAVEFAKDDDIAKQNERYAKIFKV